MKIETTVGTHEYLTHYIRYIYLIIEIETSSSNKFSICFRFEQGTAIAHWIPDTQI